MCIICYKGVNVAPPTEDCIRTMFTNNPHGAGVLIKRKGKRKYSIHKGYMNIDTFLEELGFLDIKPEDEVVYHFRIATAGGVVPALTHPFPITDNVKELFSQQIDCTRAFIHNGILGPGEGKLSDTQLYIRDSLAGVVSIKDSLTAIKQSTVGSRCIVMDIKEGTFLTGTWVYTDGLVFSNSSYTPRAYTYLDDSYYGGYKYTYDGEKNTPAIRNTYKSSFRAYNPKAAGCGYGYTEFQQAYMCDVCTRIAECTVDHSDTTVLNEMTSVFSDDALMKSYRTKKFDCAHKSQKEHCIGCPHYWECIDCNDGADE